MYLWKYCRFSCVVIAYLAVFAFARPVRGAEMRFTLLPGEDMPGAVIVPGDGLDEYAGRLRDMLKSSLGVDVVVAAPDKILEPGTWRIAGEWLDRPLVVMGSIENNRLMLALLSHYLAGSHSGGYPGEGRYVLRTVFEPFSRGAHMLVMGAGDNEGIRAGIGRMDELLASNRGVFSPLIELGDSEGPVADYELIGSFGSISQEAFVRNVYNFYWYGDTESGRNARQHIIDQMAARETGLWNFHRGRPHSAWTKTYRALRQLLATGVFSPGELSAIADRMTTLALDAADPSKRYIERVMGRDDFYGRFDRHHASAMAGAYVLLDYLENVGCVPEERREEVTRTYRLYTSTLDTFLSWGALGDIDEGLEGIQIMSKTLDMYIQRGDARLVDDGILRHMADSLVAQKDNHGSRAQAGQSNYYGTLTRGHFQGTWGGHVLAYAALLYRDGQYVSLSQANLVRPGVRHQANYSYPPEFTNVLSGIVPPAPVERYTGLLMLPLEPWRYGQATGSITLRADRQWGDAPEQVYSSISAPPERTYSHAMFRDGITTDDAYMFLQGMNVGMLSSKHRAYQANAIIRYTELGSLLLYANSGRVSSWAHSVVSTSRGANDPQSASCIVRGSFNTAEASGIVSLMEQDGGAAWQRAVVRRRNGYFVVLDRISAHHDDTYNSICRWRSFNKGQMLDDGRTFEAVDIASQVRLRISSAEPVFWTARYAPSDGSARPTMVRQLQQRQMRRGDSMYFRNLLYASGENRPRRFGVKPLGESGVMVEGSGDDFSGLAAVAVDGIETDALQAEGTLVYLSSTDLAVAGFRNLNVDGMLELRTDGEADLVMSAGKGWIENNGPDDVVIEGRGFEGFIVRVGGRVLDDSAVIPPGRLPIEVDPAHFSSIIDEWLASEWNSTSYAGSIPAPVLDSTETVGMEEIWFADGVLPDYLAASDFICEGRPSSTRGPESYWFDGGLRAYRGNIRHAGWRDGEEASIFFDFGSARDISEIRFTAGRKRRGEPFLGPDEFLFDLELSNDGFQSDVRRSAGVSPEFRVFYNERQSRIYTYRYETLAVPVHDAARYIRVIPRRVGGTGGFYAGQIDVMLASREDVLNARLYPVVLRDGSRGILYSARQSLKMFTACGSMLWARDIGAPVACDIRIADATGDGFHDILVMTLDEQFQVYLAETGEEAFSYDVFGVHDGYQKGWTDARPDTFTPWRTDERGRPEFLFFTHYRTYRLGPWPSMDFSDRRAINISKHAFTVPDIDGDGRDDLLGFGRNFILEGFFSGNRSFDSADDWVVDLRWQPTGYSSGQNYLPLYFDGGPVHDKHGNYLGVVTVNPGGLNFYDMPAFTDRHDDRTLKAPVEKWNNFHHPELKAYAQADITGTGVPEIIIGREDGCVIAYCAASGNVVARAVLDGEMRALAAPGGYVAAGTENGLSILDADLNVVAHRPGAVAALAVLKCSDSPPVLVAAWSSGALTGYRLNP